LRIDRETERGSWIAFAIFFLLLVAVVWFLPSVSNLTKILQVARIVTLVGIFALMTFSLNLHTGITGMTNFGVIFFVGIGAITVGLLAAPVETNGYGWSPWAATAVAVLLAAVAGWLLAYPTARLRADYFAILTVSLGEMLQIGLQAEPLLRAGTVTSAIGISQYSRPLEGWWESGASNSVGNVLGLPNGAPYVFLLAVMTVAVLLAVWYLLNTLLASPWGRILRSIREDEEVSQHHGHNIMTHKAASLAVGAAIAGLSGALWAWLNVSIFPDFMNPVRSTFLVWAAFIVGGRGNMRGMVVGAFLIVIVEFVFNVMIVARGNPDLAFHGLTTYLDGAFSWIIKDLGGLIWSDRSISEAFPREEIRLALSHLKLALIGAVIIVALLVSPKGLLPEVPGRPKRPATNEGKEEGE
jgi:ABC-type branched-subunit amino acid transport system permease subunit